MTDTKTTPNTPAADLSLAQAEAAGMLAPSRGFSDEQAAANADWVRANVHKFIPEGMSPEQAKQFQADMHKRLVGASEPNDPATDWRAAYQPARPQDFDFRAPAGPNDRDATATDTAMRASLSALGLSRETGNAVAEYAIQAAARWEKMTDDQRRDHESKGLASLKKLWGPNFDANMALTKAHVAAAGKRAPVARWLESGVAADPLIISQIFAAATHAKMRGEL